MIQKTFNNQNYQFPEGTTDEQIEDYFKKIDPDRRGVVADIGLSAVDGVRDGLQATIGLVDDLGDTLGEKLNIGKIQFGSDAENGFLGYKEYDKLTEKELQERKGDFIELPDFERDPDTIAGEVTKGVAQFLTGWFTGGRVLKGVKAVTGAGKVAKATGKGAIADFQAFDENTGRLVDIVNEHAPSLSNPVFDYLASDPDDAWYEARFKNALEGAGLGASLEGTFKAFRWYKNKKSQSSGQKYNKKQLEEDEKFLSNANEEDIVVTKYRPMSDEFNQEFTKNLEKDLEDSIFGAYKDAQKQFTEGSVYNPNKKIKSRDFDNLLDDLDISYNFNIKQMIEMDKNGLISEEAFTKAYSKLIRDKKIVVTDDQVERTAKKLYEGKPNVLETDIVRLADDLKQAPAKVVALNAYRNFLNNSMKRIAILSSKEPKAKQLLLRVFLPKLQLVNAGKTSISSNIARTQRLQATSFDTPNARDQETLIKEFEEYGGDVDEFIRKIGASGNADVSKVLQYARENRTWDVLNEVWINALLSNPKTHLINMSSNVFNMFVRPLEKAIGSRLILGNSRKAQALRAEGKKALGSYVAMGRHLKDSIKYAGIALKNEDAILTSRTKLDTPRKSIQKTKLVEGEEVLDDSFSGKLINNLGKIVRLPSRFLTAEDEFFKQIQYRDHLEKFAFDKAVREGKSTTKIVANDVVTRKPITEFEQAVVDNFNEGFDKYGRARIKSVLKQAEEGTYTNELTGIFKRIADTTNEYPILKQILPFTRTPVNLMLNVVDRTPLGFIRQNFRDDFFGRNGATRMAQARGGLATGFSMMTYASYLWSQGYITGVQGQTTGEKITKSYEAKQFKKSTGRVPYAFRYYDEEAGTYKYREFGRFDPFGAFFGLVADFNTFYDQLNEQEAQRLGSNTMILIARQGGDVSDYLDGGTKLANATSAIGSAVTRNLVSKTYLKGLADFMETITDDDPNKWSRYAKSKFGSFIPNIYAKFVNDPFYRDTRSILDEVKKRSGTAEVEFKYDFRGDAMRIQGDETQRFINGVFNPFGETTQKIDPVADEVIRLGINLPSMKTNLRGDIDLTLFVNKKGQTAYNRQQELLRKVRIGGKSLDQAMQIAITSSGYKKLSEPTAIDRLNRDEGGKAKLLKSIVNDYHTAVEELLMKEATSFRSTKDDTGNFTLRNSMDAVNNNINKLKTGINLKPNDLNSLYEFSK